MNIFILIVQGFLATALVLSGGFKLLPGDNKPKQNYAKMRLPLWWLTPIGFIEVIAGLCLVIGFFVPGWTAFGAVIAIVTMTGAVLSYIIQDERYEGYPALVLLMVGSLVLWSHWAEVSSFWL